MKVKELLTKDNWIQGAFARTQTGHDVRGTDPAAVCWCLAGAIQMCYPPSERNTQVRAVDMYIINKWKFDSGIYRFNDSVTWEVIEEVIDNTGI